MTDPLCDTVGILTTDSVVQEEKPYPFYEDMGFLQGDSMLHPEVTVAPTGFDGVLRPYQLMQDEWVTLLVLLCFAFLVLIQKKIRTYVSEQAREFFLPSRNITKKDKISTNSERLIPWVMMLLICIMGGLSVYMYNQNRQIFFLGQMSPYQLIGLYTGIWAAYFLVKLLLSGFLNWIFFDREKKQKWRKSVFFLFTVEALLFFPLIIITIYLNLPPHIPLQIAFILVIFIKILHLYKTFLIFFPKFHGTLHLIVYFCTLEIVPLMAVFMALIRVTDIVLVK